MKRNSTTSYVTPLRLYLPCTNINSLGQSPAITTPDSTATTDAPTVGSEPEPGQSFVVLVVGVIAGIVVLILILVIIILLKRKTFKCPQEPDLSTTVVRSVPVQVDGDESHEYEQVDGEGGNDTIAGKRN